jgi:hypothetical protein
MQTNFASRCRTIGLYVRHVQSKDNHAAEVNVNMAQADHHMLLIRTLLHSVDCRSRLTHTRDSSMQQESHVAGVVLSCQLCDICLVEMHRVQKSSGLGHFLKATKGPHGKFIGSSFGSSTDLLARQVLSECAYQYRLICRANHTRLAPTRKFCDYT